MDTGLEPFDSTDKENGDVSNSPVDTAVEKPTRPESCESSIAAPSPNTMRKRRREEIARKVESRKALITTACSSRLDMTKVQSILSGPRLSWDWKGGSSKKPEGDGEDDDSCGLIVDFHQDSRSALKTHISKTMSQMASRDISSQSVPATMPGHQEDIRQIIQMKRRLMCSQAVQLNKSSQIIENEDLEEPKDDLPELEPISSSQQADFVHAWQETQLPAPTVSQSEPLESTQVFVRLTSPKAATADVPLVEEEIEMDDVGCTQVYIPPTAPVSKPVNSSRQLKPQVSKASSTISIPPNSVPERSDTDESEESSSEEEPEKVEEPVVRKKQSISDEASFEQWLAERKRKQKLRKKHRASDNAKMFVEAEAEESEDEELGGIMRRTKKSDDDDDSSEDSEEDSDLEDLVASARDEFELLQKGGRDGSKLAKLHAKWLEEKDEQLQKAIEEKEFWRRKRSGLGALDDGGTGDGLNRMQRKLKARRDALVQQFDSEGNPLAPEMGSDDSEYDSMEIDSDDFFDEFSDDDDQRQVLDEHELAARKARRERELERRKKDKELRLEMQQRRQMLKAKLREERMLKEKDKREIQAGLGIMAEEDREAFKLVQRTQGGFGYTQSGITTQSTSASVSSQATPVFSFLKASDLKPVNIKSRRSSIASLELE